jgi:hypothetical protein
MLPTRTAIVNDTGGGTDGTVLDNAWKQEFYDQIDASTERSLTTSTVTGAQNNYAPTGFSTTAGHCTLPWNGAADAIFSGFTAGINGQRVTWFNLSATKVAYFKHNNSSSSAGNKFANIATSGDTPIAAGGYATFQYDTSGGTGVWRLLYHEQGAWITPTFAAGNFTGNASMTWTVDAGDVSAFSFKLSGRSLTVAWNIATTTVGGTPNTNLQISNAAWGGFTPASSGREATHSYVDNGGELIGRCFAQSTAIGIQKSGLGNWTASTNATATFGTTTFDVT